MGVFGNLGQGVSELITLGLFVAFCFLVLAAIVANTTVAANVGARTAINNISDAITDNVVGFFGIMLLVVVAVVILGLLAYLGMVGYRMWKGGA